MTRQSRMDLRPTAFDRLSIGRWLQSVLLLGLMVMCIAVLAWTRNKLQLPTYWNQNMQAISLTDIFNNITSPKPLQALPPMSTVSKVLLVSYNRGGSTFLGEAMNSNPDIFYWFEPLAAIYEAKYGPHGHNVATISADESFYWNNFTEEERQMTTGVFHDIFNCSLDNIPSIVYSHSFMTKRHWIISNKMQQYRKCISQSRPARKKRDVPSILNDNWKDTSDLTKWTAGNIFVPLDIPVNPIPSSSIAKHTMACIKNLIPLCNKSPVIVVKTIRVRLSMLMDIWNKDPSVKVIYYVRDPRGLLSSRYKNHQHDNVYGLENVVHASSELCQILRQDRKQYEKLKGFKKKILLIKYEDLAIRPLQTTVQMYRFLGLDIRESVLHTMHGLTHSHEDDTGMGTRRYNAGDTASAWTQTFPPDILSQIEYNCMDVMEAYGYQIT